MSARIQVRADALALVANLVAIPAQRFWMPHEPCFSLRTHGGVSVGEQWIYDGDETIARLEDKVVEQPEQNLRYFDRVLNPVVLRDLRLSPGGRPLFAGVQLFWILGGGIITSELLAIQPDGVRLTQLNASNRRFLEATGSNGDPTLASAEIGRAMLELKINAALQQIYLLRRHSQ